jgi:hypothetical protein
LGVKVVIGFGLLKRGLTILADHDQTKFIDPANAVIWSARRS